MAGIVALAIFMFGGCAVKSPTVDSRAEPSEPYVFETEGQVPPLDESRIKREVDKDDVFEEIAVPEEAVAAESVHPLPQSAGKDGGEPEAETWDGYRVQVFASGSGESAQSIREAVQIRLGTSAYIVQLDGIYKVRIGDCRNRSEAETLLLRCREAGYQDAWIVSSRVNVKKGRS
jgi:hypothetical protein